MILCHLSVVSSYLWFIRNKEFSLFPTGFPGPFWRSSLFLEVEISSYTPLFVVSLCAVPDPLALPPEIFTATRFFHSEFVLFSRLLCPLRPRPQTGSFLLTNYKDFLSASPPGPTALSFFLLRSSFVPPLNDRRLFPFTVPQTADFPVLVRSHDLAPPFPNSLFPHDLPFSFSMSL